MVTAASGTTPECEISRPIAWWRRTLGWLFRVQQEVGIVLRSASTGLALVIFILFFAPAGRFSGVALAGDPMPAKEAAAEATPATKGSLVIVGGGLRFNNDEIWGRIVALAPAPDGTKPKIAVFPTASANPVTTGTRIVEALKRYGAEAFVVPVAMRSMEQPYEQAVQDPQLVESVKSAHGVFFSGGSQRHITTALYTKEGKHTPMLDAIWAVYRGGGVIAGTSAGAAVMSHVMCRDARKVLATLQDGVKMGREVDRGLGFLDADWFVDQHAAGPRPVRAGVGDHEVARLQIWRRRR